MDVPLIIYFCTNFFLLFFGLLFLLPLIMKTKEEYDIIKQYIFGNILHVYTGIFILILGFIILIFPYDTILIIGDLIPAVALIIVSLTLFFGYIRLSKSVDNSLLSEGQAILEKLQIPIGFMSISAGIIHILLPAIIFL